MTGQTRGILLHNGIILAVARLAGIQIVAIVSEKNKMRGRTRHKIIRMRIAGVAFFAGYSRRAAAQVGAVTHLTWLGVIILRGEQCAVKSCGGRIEPTLRMGIGRVAGAARNTGGAAIELRAVTSCAFCEAIILPGQHFAVKRLVAGAHPTFRMRKRSVAGFARGLDDAAIILIAVAFPAALGVIILLRQDFAMKICGGGIRPAGAMNLDFVLRGGRRLLRVATPLHQHDGKRQQQEKKFFNRHDFHCNLPFSIAFSIARSKDYLRPGAKFV